MTTRPALNALAQVLCAEGVVFIAAFIGIVMILVGVWK